MFNQLETMEMGHMLALKVAHSQGSLHPQRFFDTLRLQTGPPFVRGHLSEVNV